MMRDFQCMRCLIRSCEPPQRVDASELPFTKQMPQKHKSTGWCRMVWTSSARNHLTGKGVRKQCIFSTERIVSYTQKTLTSKQQHGRTSSKQMLWS